MRDHAEILGEAAMVAAVPGGELLEGERAGLRLPGAAFGMAGRIDGVTAVDQVAEGFGGENSAALGFHRVVLGSPLQLGWELGMVRIVLVLMVVALAGCTRFDGGAMSKIVELRPAEEPNKYVFKAFADAAYPLENEESEKLRLKELDIRMKDNKFCKDGYQVDERRTARIGTRKYHLYYYVSCRESGKATPT